MFWDKIHNSAPSENFRRSNTKPSVLCVPGVKFRASLSDALWDPAVLHVLASGIWCGVISLCTLSSCSDVMVKEVGDLKMSEFMVSIWVLLSI